MRAPLEWLYRYCDPGLSEREVEERLTMTGTKVEAVHHHGVGALEHFVVGKVLESGRHPDADRLSVCRVDVGGGHTAQIVCGAPNVAGGQTVAVARPGAVMPGGTQLGRAKLRGVESEGMILAEDELAIGTEHAGIMVLDELVENGPALSAAPASSSAPLVSSSSRTMIPACSVPIASSSSARIMPSDSTPRSFARPSAVPPGITAPGRATATVWPPATFGAPHTICAV